MNQEYFWRWADFPVAAKTPKLNRTSVAYSTWLNHLFVLEDMRSNLSDKNIFFYHRLQI
jgi:hypothetical protein